MLIEPELDHGFVPKPRMGRPPKPVTAEERHEAEMAEWDKLATRVRKVIEGQISSFEQRLQNASEGRDTLNLDAQLSIVAALKDLSSVIMKIKVEGRKPAASGKVADVSDSIEDIRRELEGGKG